MSDLGSELKNAVLSPNAKTVKVALYAHGPEMWEVAKRWFGKLESCQTGEEDLFLFECSEGALPKYLRGPISQAIERGSHVFQFDPHAENFVRRDGFWFDKR